MWVALRKSHPQDGLSRGSREDPEQKRPGNTQDLHLGKKMQNIRPVGIAVHSGKSYSC